MFNSFSFYLPKYIPLLLLASHSDLVTIYNVDLFDTSLYNLGLSLGLNHLNLVYTPKLAWSLTVLASNAKLLMGFAGVYGFYCSRNGKFYAGSAHNMGIRPRQHLQVSTYCNPHFWNSLKKYGFGAFTFMVFLNVSATALVVPAQLLALEQMLLDNVPRGWLLNINLIAGSVAGFKHTPESLAKMEKVRTKVFVFECVYCGQIDKYLSMASASLATGIKENTLSTTKHYGRLANKQWKITSHTNDKGEF